MATNAGVAADFRGQLVAAQRGGDDRLDEVGHIVVGGRHARLAGQSAGSEQGRGALVGVRGRGEGAKAGRRLGLRAIAGEMQLRDRRDGLRLSVEGRLVGARLAAHVGDVLDGLGDFPALARR